MFVKIKPTKSLYKTLQYNEEKINHGKAECILSRNFIKELDQLTKKDKQARFLQRTSLNEKAEQKILRISLSFDVSEKISNDVMQKIATRYLKEMGFEKQPYLVYRHYDSGHPHCHLITTSIKADGSKIDLKLREYLKSQKVIKTLEKEFILFQRQKIKPSDEEKFKVQQAQRVSYGKSGLKHSISDVLNTVVDHYKYTSLNELNALLQLYNVKATRGNKNSKIYQHKGLLYHALDEKGNRKGKSIKASDFLLKPTLARLERKFGLNESLRQVHQQRIKTAINWTLAGAPPDWEGFKQAMEKEGIAVVHLTDAKAGIENIFFVDHDTKCVFGGESLGEKYMLKAIREKCAEDQRQKLELEEKERQTQRLNFGNL